MITDELSGDFDDSVECDPFDLLESYLMCGDVSDPAKTEAFDAIVKIRARVAELEAAGVLELEQYDAGFLSDFGGGNVGWWQDYMRSELERAHDFYQSQVYPQQTPARQVPEGWQLVPVEPAEEMRLHAQDYLAKEGMVVSDWLIDTVYKEMLSACPSPAITKDFSQFLSAVMDAAGLIRHGRQSKELSEYLGMKCMEYRGVAPSAGSQKEQGE